MFAERPDLTKMSDNQGRLSPISSTSSQHVEEPDNTVEYYVKASKEESEYVDAANNSRKEVCCTCKFFVETEESCTVVSGRIEAKAYCKLYIEGGEKMTEKGLDVNESITTDTSYDHGTSTTEPDPQSELAMQKAAAGGPTYTKPAQQDGVGTYSTTANSTVDAPASGETTEPSNIHKANDMDMQLCNCAGMSKCVGCACAGCQTCDGCDGEDCQGCSCDHGVAKAAGCNCCSDCGSNCNGDCCKECSMTTKAADDCCDDCGPDCSGDCCDDCQMMDKISKAANSDDEKDEPAPDVEELEKSTKSIWNNAFAPGIPTAALRTVFRQE